MFVSLALHGLVIAAFAVSPPVPRAPMPEFLSVDLVAPMPVGGPRPAARVPAPPTPPAPAETTQPEPEAPPTPAPAAEAPPPPPPEPAPPVTKAPVQVLPEETPGRIREAKPEPEEVAKVEPEPKPVPKPVARPAPKKPPTPSATPRRRRGEKEEELSFEDAMAALENELGRDETADLLKPQGREDGVAEAEPTASSRPGRTASPEQVAWDREVLRMIRNRFPNFARYGGRGLSVDVEVVVSATGELTGSPRLLQTSGDLDFDRLAIAVLERAAPLPPPPRPGPRHVRLNSEER